MACHASLTADPCACRGGRSCHAVGGAGTCRNRRARGDAERHLREQAERSLCVETVEDPLGRPVAQLVLRPLLDLVPVRRPRQVERFEVGELTLASQRVCALSKGRLHTGGEPLVSGGIGDHLRGHLGREAVELLQLVDEEHERSSSLCGAKGGRRGQESAPARARRGCIARSSRRMTSRLARRSRSRRRARRGRGNSSNAATTLTTPPKVQPSSRSSTS